MFLVSCFRVAWFAICRRRGYHHYRTDGTLPLDLFAGIASALLGEDRKPVSPLFLGSRNGRFPSSLNFFQSFFERWVSVHCCCFRLRLLLLVPLVVFVVPVKALCCVLGFWWGFVIPPCYFFGFCFFGGVGIGSN